jgi:hypothetical protein
MTRDPSNPLGQPEQPGYEERDVDTRGVTRIAAALVIVLILCCLVSASYFFFLEKRTTQLEGPILSALPRSEKPFPRPQLQADPALDYAEYHRAEEERLTQYRWIDREKGIVAIPIDRAIELTLERGLPFGPEAAQGANAPTWQEMLQSRAATMPVSEKGAQP